MDPVSKFIATWKIPVGRWGKALIDFIVTYFQWFFDGLSAVLEWSVEGTTFLLLQIPPVILVVLLAGFAYWLQKSRNLA
ncbi:MAG TPA: choline ABC transporter permease subunit, partial [Aestuariivirga sp.]|nr:choline ABC transporter permease subunit [Aestuariivirga sp.]